MTSKDSNILMEIEMFENVLDKYKDKGYFSFKPEESLKDKCNAPSDKSGIYLIFKVENSIETLIYIGSSGQKSNGMLKTRKAGLGGMKDRLVNGYHPKFEKAPRRKTFPIRMKMENIPELIFQWWVTYDDLNQDFPTDVEKRLTAIFINKYGRLPDWHIE